MSDIQVSDVTQQQQESDENKQLRIRYQTMLDQLIEDGLFDMAYQILKTTYSRYNIQLIAPQSLQEFITTQHASFVETVDALQSDLTDFTAFAPPQLMNLKQLNTDVVSDAQQAGLNSSTLVTIGQRGHAAMYAQRIIGVIAAITTDSKYLAVCEGNNGILVYYTNVFFPCLNEKTKHHDHHSTQNQAIPSLARWEVPRGVQVRNMKWHPTDNLLFVLANNGTILMYSMTSKFPIYIRDVDNILCFDIHPTGKFLVYAAMDSPLIKLYDLTTFMCYIPQPLDALCKQHRKVSKALNDFGDDGDDGKRRRRNNNNNNNQQQQPDVPHLLTDVPPELPQQPVIDVQYSHFGQFFACVTFDQRAVSRQGYYLDVGAGGALPPGTNPPTTHQLQQSTYNGTNPHVQRATVVPIATLRVYSTQDHSLVHFVELPMNEHLIKMIEANQNQSFPTRMDAHTTNLNTNQYVSDSINRPINPQHIISAKYPYNHYPPLLDLFSNPTMLQWSPNDKFIICSLYIQPHIPTLDPATGAVTRSIVHNTPYYTPTNVVFLYDVTTNAIVQTYSTKLPDPPQEPAAKLPNTPVFPYTGFTTFFSKNSLQVFLPTYPNVSTKLVKHEKKYTNTDTVTQGGNTTTTTTSTTEFQYDTSLSSYVQAFNTVTAEKLDMVSMQLDVQPLKCAYSQPLCIIPDNTKNMYYVFTVTGESFVYQYDTVKTDAYLQSLNPGKSYTNNNTNNNNMNSANNGNIINLTQPNLNSTSHLY